MCWYCVRNFLLTFLESSKVDFYIQGFELCKINLSKNIPHYFDTFSTVINRVMRISSYLWALNYKDNENDEKTQDNGAEPYDGGRIQASREITVGSCAWRST